MFCLSANTRSEHRVQRPCKAARRFLQNRFWVDLRQFCRAEAVCGSALQFSPRQTSNQKTLSERCVQISQIRKWFYFILSLLTWWFSKMLIQLIFCPSGFVFSDMSMILNAPIDKNSELRKVILGKNRSWYLLTLVGNVMRILQIVLFLSTVMIVIVNKPSLRNTWQILSTIVIHL